MVSGQPFFVSEIPDWTGRGISNLKVKTGGVLRGIRRVLSYIRQPFERLNGEINLNVKVRYILLTLVG